MGSKGQINSIVDEKAIQQQVNKLKGQLEELHKLIGKMSTDSAMGSNNIKNAKGTTELNNALANQAIVIEKVVKAQNSLKQTKTEYQIITEKMAKAEAAAAAASNGGYEQVKRTIAANKELADIKKKVLDELRQEEVLTKKAAQAKKDEEKAINKLIQAGERRAAAMNKEIAAQQKQIAKEAEHQAALKMEVKTIDDAIRQNKALTIERNKSITSAGKQSKEVQALNAKMTQNTEFVRQNGTAMEKQRMNIGNYKSALSGLGTMMLASFSVGTVLAFGRAIFTASEDQEKANRKLLASLGGNKQAFKELNTQAARLMEMTGVPDEAINNIQMLGAAAELSTANIKRITDASVYLSVATGRDLDGSYQMLMKSLTGVGRGLKVLGPEFANLSTEQLKSGDAITIVIKKYMDIAKAAASETDKLKANWGEAKENLGKSVASPLNNFFTKFNADLVITNSKYLTFWEKLTNGREAANKLIAERQGKEENANAWRTEDIKNSPVTKALTEEAVAIAKAKVNSKEYIQAIKDAMIESGKYPQLVTKAIEKQIGAYAKLTQRISDSKEQINNLLALGQTPSNELLKKLSDDEQKIIDIGKAAEFAMRKMIAAGLGDVGNTLQGKGISAINSIAKDGKSPLTARDNSAGGGATAETPGFFQTDAGQTAIDIADTTTSTIFDIEEARRAATLENTLRDLETEKNAKLSNARLTAAQKAKIEAEYDAKARKIRNEAAKKEKTAQVLNAISAGILSVLSATSAIPHIPGAGVKAAIASAALVAKLIMTPVPKYAKGRKGGPAEMAVVGEEGIEAIVNRGKVELTPDRPTMTFLPQGASVIPNKDLMSMSESISMGRIPQYDGAFNTKELERKISDLYGGFEMLAGVVKSKKEFHAVFDKNGVEAFIRNGASQTDYVNNNIRF